VSAREGPPRVGRSIRGSVRPRFRPDAVQRRKLARLGDDAVLNKARDQHYRRYPRLHRIRLHRLWTGLHFGIAAYGLALIIITISR
jgi:hypothetical protein